MYHLIQMKNMKSLRKLLYIIPLTGMMVTSCMDVENIEIDHIGGYATMNNAESEAYYANLRAYKATAWNYNRPVAFDGIPIGRLLELIEEDISLLCPIVWILFLCGVALQDVMKSLRSRRQIKSLCKR